MLEVGLNASLKTPVSWAMEMEQNTSGSHINKGFIRFQNLLTGKSELRTCLSWSMIDPWLVVLPQLDAAMPTPSATRMQQMQCVHTVSWRSPLPDKAVQEQFLGSFLAPETDLIFGDGVGASLDSTIGWHVFIGKNPGEIWSRYQLHDMSMQCK